MLSLPNDKVDFIDEFFDCFNGVGNLLGKCKIQLKTDSIPSLKYKKKIPLSLLDRLKNELDVMCKQVIINQVNYPTDWVNNVQLVEKSNGRLRICLDPKPLNLCIKREHFLIPISDGLLSHLTGKRVFTVLDLSNGFWQMELDVCNADLTTLYGTFWSL